MPVFFFALANAETTSITNILITFVSIHLFLYPASNAYNSYFDRDEGSIGGLKAPPKVEESLLYLSLIFDVIALLLSALINSTFFFMVLVYGLISKAYSHPKIRLKKRPYLGLIIVSLFQGWFTFLMIVSGLESLNINELLIWELSKPGLLTTMLLLGSYPMTQIYQHSEDGQRGDRTISLILGVKGTFFFTTLVFSIATALYAIYFSSNYSTEVAMIFILILSPVLVFFLWWFAKSQKSLSYVNYKNAMRLNTLSALCLNLFFIYLNFVEV